MYIESYGGKITVNSTLAEEAALDIGFKAFTYKPFVKANLAKMIRKVLDKANIFIFSITVLVLFDFTLFEFLAGVELYSMVFPYEFFL